MRGCQYSDPIRGTKCMAPIANHQTRMCLNHAKQAIDSHSSSGRRTVGDANSKSSTATSNAWGTKKPPTISTPPAPEPKPVLLSALALTPAAEVGLLECTVCADDKRRCDRRYLPCGHTICSDCVENIRKTTIQKRSQGTECPFCRELVSQTEELPRGVEWNEAHGVQKKVPTAWGNPEEKATQKDQFAQLGKGEQGAELIREAQEREARARELLRKGVPVTEVATVNKGPPPLKLAPPPRALTDPPPRVSPVVVAAAAATSVVPQHDVDMAELTGAYFKNLELSQAMVANKRAPPPGLGGLGPIRTQPPGLVSSAGGGNAETAAAATTDHLVQRVSGPPPGLSTQPPTLQSNHSSISTTVPSSSTTNSSSHPPTDISPTLHELANATMNGSMEDKERRRKEREKTERAAENAREIALVKQQLQQQHHQPVASSTFAMGSQHHLDNNGFIASLQASGMTDSEIKEAQAAATRREQEQRDAEIAAEIAKRGGEIGRVNNHRMDDVAATATAAVVAEEKLARELMYGSSNGGAQFSSMTMPRQALNPTLSSMAASMEYLPKQHMMASTLQYQQEPQLMQQQQQHHHHQQQGYASYASSSTQHQPVSMQHMYPQQQQGFAPQQPQLGGYGQLYGLPQQVHASSPFVSVQRTEVNPLQQQYQMYAQQVHQAQMAQQARAHSIQQQQQQQQQHVHLQEHQQQIAAAQKQRQQIALVQQQRMAQQSAAAAIAATSMASSRAVSMMRSTAVSSSSPSSPFWSCPTCTFENKPDFLICAMCMEKRSF